METLINKELAILDEYKFNKKKRERDLKLFEGQPIVEDVKYSKQQTIKELNIIALSNYTIDPLNANSDLDLKYTDEALTNRSYIVEFIKSNLSYNEFLTTKELKKIEKEDPYILIFCNRILQEYFLSNKGKTNSKYILKYYINSEILVTDKEPNILLLK
jgi:hypothetical protein